MFLAVNLAAALTTELVVRQYGQRRVTVVKS